MIAKIPISREQIRYYQERNARIRILFAEDDVDVNFITRLMLEKFGYDVTSTYNGKTALKLYTEDFDIVVTDIVMPELNGADLIIELRKINPKVKCVAITGFPDVEIPKGVPVLIKPVTITKLLETLENISDETKTSELNIQGD